MSAAPMTAPDLGFNAEQEMVVRLLRQAGVADAEAVVDGQRSAAAYFGSFLLPVITARAAALTAHDQAAAVAALADREDA